MTTVPCALCGYDAPAPACPHCGQSPREPSLDRPLRGPWSGVWEGIVALPRGLHFLATTPGVKRWLVPPLLVTTVILVALSWWLFSTLDTLLDSVLPGSIELGREWAWLEGLSERWDWLKSAWIGLVAAAQWTLNAGWSLVSSQPLRVLGWFLIASLAVWYCFSIAYEALAGPFLDEVQARLEERWFGADPRSRLERPNDIPRERCVRLSLLTLAVLIAIGIVAGGLAGLAWWLVLLFTPLALVPGVLVDRRYAAWLAWVARVEGRAVWASLQAALVTGALIVVALPLYFVPGAGYLLFALVCGFATAVGLLDIPLERRGWRIGQRLRFLAHNLPAMLAFGGVAGVLLAVPVIGPVLMVPAASIGGLWLICRLDKTFLRTGAHPDRRRPTSAVTDLRQQP